MTVENRDELLAGMLEGVALAAVTQMSALCDYIENHTGYEGYDFGHDNDLTKEEADAAYEHAREYVWATIAPHLDEIARRVDDLQIRDHGQTSAELLVFTARLFTAIGERTRWR